MRPGKDIERRLTQLPPEKQALLRTLLKNRSGESGHLVPRGADEPVPLAAGQTRLWLLENLSWGAGAYNETNSLRFDFPLDVESLRRALTEVARRQEALRMRVELVDGVPFQRFEAPARVDLPLVDLRHLAPNEREAEALLMAAEQGRVPFDLCMAPPMRATLYRLGEADHLFVITLHHMVCDGWSMGVLMVELMTLYWSFATGKPSPLPELRIRYGDYAIWQQRGLRSGQLVEQMAFWREQLADVSMLELPADHPRPAQFSFRGARCPVVIDGATQKEISALTARLDITPFMFLFGIFAVLLHRYTGQDGFAIGTPSAGRSRRELEPIIGFFVNTLVLRADASGDPPFTEFLQRVRKTATDAFAHQDVAFEHIVDELQTPRDKSRNPIYQTMFQLMSRPGAPGLDRRALLPFVSVDTGTVKFDLSLELTATDDGVSGYLVYCVDLFDADRMRRMVSHFLRLIECVLRDPTQRLSQLELQRPEDLRLLHSWNETAADFPRDQTLAGLFLQQAERTPHAPALSFGDRTWSYAQLRDWAAVVAEKLRSQGVQAGDLVCVHLDRGPELVPALLGVLLTGAAYVPLDPGSPPARLAYLVENSGARVVITTAAQESTFEGGASSRLLIEEWSNPGASSINSAHNAEAAAYVIYTSGTTGRPKGVVASHRNVVRLAFTPSAATVTEGMRVLHLASPAFDAATFEIWGCLLNGGHLIVYPPGAPTVEDLAAFINAQRIAVAFATTGLFHQLIERCAGDLRGVSRLITGGEVLSPPLAKAAWKALPRTILLNAYGPTEGVTFATMCVIDESTLKGPVPIGRPIENARAYVLDRYGNMVPIGIPGELCVGGDGVAIGYWRLPDLTREKFVASPFVDGDRLYRTGDVAAWREDGNLVFLGRRDRQVKLSGHRIELGEVEATILENPRIREATVLLTGNESPRLTAFCQLAPEEELTFAELRQFLSTRLPACMLPSRLTVVDQFPLTRNGKLDVPALLEKDSSREPGEVRAAPTTTLERELLDLWCELLEVEGAGVSDNFFESGGQSLLAMRLLSRVRARYGVPVTMRDFFDDPSVIGLAARVASATHET